MKLACCICGARIRSYCNNAEPLKKGWCCIDCNLKKVLPARFEALGIRWKHED